MIKLAIVSVIKLVTVSVIVLRLVFNIIDLMSKNDDPNFY